jgi:DNA polymerase-4
MVEPVFFHVDLDAFFASVEILDNPDLAGKPVLIGSRAPRSVVSTCSYEARRYGIHSAMPMVQALRLCPSAIVIRGRMKRYSEKSHEVMELFKSFTPDIRQISIDEAFLDMSGFNYLYKDKKEAALALKQKVKEHTGLVISVGVGPSRLIAKMASDYNKPDGLCIVDAGMEIPFVDAVGLWKLWGIGKSTRDLLQKHHITDNQVLREYTQLSLEHLFGKAMGTYLYEICRGIDPGIYTQEAKSHSISTERTFTEDIFQKNEIDHALLEMSLEVIYRSLQEKQIARTIGIKIRYGNFTTFSCQITPDRPIYNASQVYGLSQDLMDRKWNHNPIRLLGVGLFQTYAGTAPMQPEFFDEDEKKKREIEKVAYSLSKKGLNLTKASLLTEKQKHNRQDD